MLGMLAFVCSVVWPFRGFRACLIDVIFMLALWFEIRPCVLMFKYSVFVSVLHVFQQILCIELVFNVVISCVFAHFVWIRTGLAE